jgi:hypothetical protein
MRRRVFATVAVTDEPPELSCVRGVALTDERADVSFVFTFVA